MTSDFGGTNDKKIFFYEMAKSNTSFSMTCEFKISLKY